MTSRYTELTDRSIIGDFFAALETEVAASWASRIGWLNDQSDQAQETYRFLGQAAPMREWVGGRHEVPLNKFSLTITNQLYESTFPVDKFDLRQDKTGQLAIRIQDQARRAVMHWERLVSDLLLANGNAYDGATFFSTTHAESGTNQANELTASEVTALNVGTATAPTPDEAAKAILGIIGKFYGIVDDQGEPANGNARDFIVMVGTSELWAPCLQAINGENLSAGASNALAGLRNSNVKIDAILNPRLAATNDELIVFRTDATVKPFILQQENFEVEVLGEGSDEAFKNHRHLFGVNANRGAGYGAWSAAMRGTLS